MPIQRERYPVDWESISACIRYQRAGNRCEWCGAPNGEPHPETASVVVLTVAHVDHDTTNNAGENLVALCQRCHNRHDGPMRAMHAAETRRERAEKAGQLVLWRPA